MPRSLLSQDQINLIESFLCKFCTVGSIPRSRLFIWMQIHELKGIINNNGWMYPYAAFCHAEYRNLFPETFWKDNIYKQEKARFNELYHTICDIPLNDYLLSYELEIVNQPEELEKLRNELVKSNPLFADDLLWQHYIYCALCAYRKSMDGHEIVETYTNLLNQSGLNTQIEADIAFDILACATMYPFNNRLRKENGNAMAACELLDKKCNFTPERMLELYADARSFLKNRKKVKNPIHYIRAAKGADSFRIDVGYDEDINEACKHIQKVKRPSDFVGVAMEREYGENSRIETGYVQTRLRKTLCIDDNILVINPSAYFVQTWPEKWQSQTTFCVMNRFEKILYSQEFSAPTFVLPDEIDDIDCFTKILYFPRPHETNAHNALMTRLCNRTFELETKKTGLMMLIPENDQYLELAKASYQGIYEDVLPRQTIGVAPKKRILATLIAGSGSKRESKQFYVQFCRPDGPVGYKDPVSKSTKGKLYLLHKKKTDVAEENKTSRASRYVEFTSDIYIWYKQRNVDGGKIRVEAAIYKLPTAKQKKRNKYARGVKLKESDSSKVCYSEDEARTWLINEYPYKNKKVQELLKKEFRSQRQAVSIKTAWYLTLNISNYSSGLARETNEARLMAYFGDIPVKETEPQRFHEKMDELRTANGLTQAEEKSAWNTLDNLFSLLVKEGYCEKNPITEINALFRPRHTRESNLRDALAKKSFSNAELKTLYQFISEKVIPSETDYLGVFLRLLTGLKPEVLCGLKWGDFNKIENANNGYQLWISRKVAPNGKECVGLGTREEYRRYPLMELASRRILERRFYILKNCSISEKDLSDKYILSSDAELTGHNCPIPRPDLLKRLSKAVIEELKMEDIKLTLPSVDGSKETVLNKYHGDIFNTNFRYHLKLTCDVTNPEERYMMGLQQKDTYSKHYVDFAHDKYQVKMMIKMNRLVAILLEPAEIPIQRIENNSGRQPIRVQGIPGHCAQVNLRFNPTEATNGLVEVSARSLYGEQITFQVMEAIDDDKL